MQTRPLSQITLCLSLAILFSACRGRDFAKAMPPLKSATTDTLLVFRSADENFPRTPRVHFIDPATGAGTELDRKTPSPVSAVLAEPHIVYGSYAVTKQGKFARLVADEETQSDHIDPHADSLLSPNQQHFIRRAPGKVVTARTDGSIAMLLKEDLAECAWRTASAFVCLAGKYQETRAIVEYDLYTRNKKTLHSITGKYKLDNLRLRPDGKAAAFTQNLADTVSVHLLDFSTNTVNTVAEFHGRYIFDLAVSADGIIAARIVNSKHTDGKLDPYDVWVSAPFGSARSAGYLLNLPSLGSPGFFSGKGFTGVDSFAFSPNGNSLAILMSGEDDCRMADEGGNLACRKDIYIAQRDKAGMRRVTQFQIQSAARLRWLRFSAGKN